jgi:hypothetical protein
LIPKSPPSPIQAAPKASAEKYATVITGSLKPGLIVPSDDRDFSRRPHAGKTSESSLQAGLSVEHESQNDVREPRRRLNRDVFVPPDNIGRGLRPYQEFSQEQKTIRGSASSCLFADSLGPGLIPLDLTRGMKDDSTKSKTQNRITGEKDGRYMRVYGVYAKQLSDCN